MAEDKQESVLDLDTQTTDAQNEAKAEVKSETKNQAKTETAAKKPAIQVNVPLTMIVMICAIASIVLAFITNFVIIVGGSFAFVTVCRCINYIALCATVVLYLIDYLKNKNFSVNPAFICVILAIIVAAF